MRFKQFLLEDKYQDKIYIFNDTFPRTHAEDQIHQRFAGIDKDKNALFYFGNGPLWNMSEDAIDKSRNIVYNIINNIKYWQYDVTVPEIIKFGKKHGLIFKLITDDELRPTTPWQRIGGLVVAFKSNKSKSKYDKEMVVEDVKPILKVGDRVRYMYALGGKPGRIGIIRVVGSIDVGVEFDGYEGGHSLGGVLKHGGGWWIGKNSNNLKLLSPRSKYDKEMVV